jgi:hypothetical protein
VGRRGASTQSKIREPARRQAEPRSRNDWPCGSRDIHDLSACRGAAKLLLLLPLPPLPPFSPGMSSSMKKDRMNTSRCWMLRGVPMWKALGHWDLSILPFARPVPCSAAPSAAHFSTSLRSPLSSHRHGMIDKCSREFLDGTDVGHLYEC